MNLTFILALAVGIFLPLIFLALVWARDLYASGSFNSVITAFVGGLAAFGGAYVLNSLVVQRVGFVTLTTTIAPVIEEVLKSIVLLYLVRRPNFTYFVDGAIYGFASGTAFAVLENPFYALNSPGGGLGLMLMRAFSTSLMHGTASALVGIALGRFKFKHGGTQGLSLLGGWAAAVLLHASFNRAAYAGWGGPVVLLAVGIGGVALVVGFILWGLREERRWLQETLGIKLGVSKGEAAVVLKMENLDEMLEPIAKAFGEDKRDSVESFIKLQAQLGLKRKAMGMTQDSQQAQALAEQVAHLRKQQDDLRRRVGVYCMSYVRSILPPETEPVWSRLGDELARERTSNKNLWGDLGGRVAQKQARGPLPGNLDNH